MLSSLLTLLLTAKPSSHIKGLLAENEIQRAGRLYLELLTTLRHLGGFYSVFDAYSVLCSQLLTAKKSEYLRIPRGWLLEVLESITSKTNISITRRSAGLPFCLLGVLCSEPNNPGANQELMSTTMQRLLQIASTPLPADFDHRVDLVQVHGFNMLRALFRNAILAQRILPHVEDGIILAIRGFSSSSWAIRNCSTMLFSVLLGRIFGINKNAEKAEESLSGREFFLRFQHLKPFLLSELREAVAQLTENQTRLVIHAGLYPVLTLLSRFSISNLEGDTTLAEFVPLVVQCSSSAVLQVREMASRALVPVLPTPMLISHCAEALAGALSSGQFRQNHLHGVLLQVRALLAGHLSKATGPEILAGVKEQICPRLLTNIWIGSTANRCNVTRAAFLQLLSAVLVDNEWCVTLSDETMITALVRLARTELFEMTAAKSQVALYRVEELYTALLLTGVAPAHRCETLIRLLQHPQYEVRLTTYRRALSFLDSLSR